VTLSNAHPRLAQALADRGYTSATPVQAAVLEPGSETRDLLVSAKTGSGKTVAYGMALAPTLLGEADRLPAAGKPLALVIAPTRELALQVERELTWLYAPAGGKVVTCVGGMDIRREQRLLAQGAHIVVGTPGRMRDHLERGHLQASGLKAVVLDEADEMLDLGFREELEEILDATPPERRTLLFSATIPKQIAAMAKRYQRDALRIVATAGEEAHGDIDYRAVRVAPSDVEHAVVNLLRFFEAGAALVFCSTREAVRRLHANLVERGFVVVALSGELSQTERTHALQALRDRRARVCVATDVAARGIDIPDLELVIHADLPNDAETLQHRSGRTGRAGRKGVCAILVPHNRRRQAERLLQTAHITAAWQGPPSAEDIKAKDQARLIDEIQIGEGAAEEDLEVARALLARHSAEELAAAFVRLSRARLPAPEDLADSEPEPPRIVGPRQGFENSSWFSISVGRNKNAEARWVLPLICRRGHLTKADIGAIRVYQTETRFEIVQAAVDRFVEAIGKTEDDGVSITRADGPLAERGERPPRHEREEKRREHRPKNERAGREFAKARPPAAENRPFAPALDHEQSAPLAAKPRGPKPTKPHAPYKPFKGKPHKGKPNQGPKPPRD
jgi:ATP-dependent RNA helicase DeaD